MNPPPTLLSPHREFDRLAAFVYRSSMTDGDRVEFWALYWEWRNAFERTLFAVTL